MSEKETDKLGLSGEWPTNYPWNKVAVFENDVATLLENILERLEKLEYYVKASKEDYHG